jgi:hypothetical protein
MEAKLLIGIPVSLQVVAVAAIVWITSYAISSLNTNRPFPGFPVIALDGRSAMDTWLWHGKKAITEGLKRFSGRPFQVVTGTGPKIVLPNNFANEIRNNPALDFDKAFAKVRVTLALCSY